MPFYSTQSLAHCSEAQKNVSTVVLVVELACLGLMAWVGRRRTEADSRHAFEQQRGLSNIADEEHQSMVNVRVLRFAAERKLVEKQRSVRGANVLIEILQADIQEYEAMLCNSQELAKHGGDISS